MKILRFVLIVTVLCLPLLTLSCDKIGGAMKKIEGKVAGQVLSASGHGRGYVSVELAPEAGGDTVNTLAEDSGNFMFEGVKPGKYVMHVKDAGGDELPSDTPSIDVGPGRTVTQNVTLQEAPAA